MEKPRLRILLAVLATAIVLPVLGNWIRRSGEAGCALDGQRIDPYFRVRIMNQDQRTNEFCCIRCAELWLDEQPARIQTILVTDEASGQEIPASSAFFVRNLVVTMKSTGNRVHVFRDQSAAENNARMFRGTLLSGGERPFARCIK